MQMVTPARSLRCRASLVRLGPVAQYWLFAGTREEFLVGEKGEQLRKAVAGVVAQCRNHLACQNEPPGRIVELITRPGGEPSAAGSLRSGPHPSGAASSSAANSSTSRSTIPISRSFL
jgi:hypothetical protein